MGLAKPGKTRGLTGTGPGLACQKAAGRVFGRFWNRTELFFRSKPEPLVGYPDPLLILLSEYIFFQEGKEQYPFTTSSAQSYVRSSAKSKVLLSFDILKTSKACFLLYSSVVSERYY